MKRQLLVMLVWLTIAIALVGCSGGGGDADIEVTGITANLSLPTDTGALYMTITNHSNEDDSLIGATVPGCGVMELHEMRMEGEVMTMQQVEGGQIPIPAGESVELARGGLHVMCLQKSGEFAVGETVEVTLNFANAGEIEVSAEVIDPAGG